MAQSPSFVIPAGTRIILRAPAQPLAREKIAHIGILLSAIPAVAEAYLPQCYLPAQMEHPTRLLVLVLESRTRAGIVVDQVTAGLTAILGPGEHMDLLPIGQHDPLLALVRKAGCRIYRALPPKRLWQLWR